MPHYMQRRLMVYLIGIFTLAIGSNLFLNAALGVAPSCSLALTFTYLTNKSYALFNFIVNTALLLIESLLIRSFGKTQIIQLLITFIYSYLIKLTSIFLVGIHTYNILGQVFLAVLACTIMALGITLTIHSNFTVMPYEGCIGALSFKTKVEFGKLRVIIDIFFTLTSIIVSFILLHNIHSVGLGTILSSFLTGNIVTLYETLFNQRINHYLGIVALN